MKNNSSTVRKPLMFINRGLVRIIRSIFGAILLFAFICVSASSVNAQDRPWPYSAKIETNDTINALVAARFGKGAKLMGGSYGQIKESVQRGWVGLIEIPASGKKSSVQTLILSEIDYLTKYKIESISRKVPLPDCFSDDSCIIEVEVNKLPVNHPIKIVWWTLGNMEIGLNTRTTFHPIFKAGRWKVNSLLREDWDEQGLNIDLVVSPSGRRSFSIQGDQGRMIGGANRPAFEQFFEDLNIFKHWPEKASDF